jgi:hypothetical protein
MDRASDAASVWPDALFVLRLLSLVDGELLEAQVLSRFDDGTRRPPTHETYILRRESK